MKKIDRTIYITQKTGRWKKPKAKDFDVYICSECKEAFIDIKTRDDSVWNYCPNCGAKMDF